MKYDEWIFSSYDPARADALAGAGYGVLPAHVLCARGLDSPEKAMAFLPTDAHELSDPFLLPDMERAVARIRAGLEAGEHMAVYGDYDVDGMTSISLLVRFLRGRGARVDYYVPDRLEEGYGLNVPALSRLRGSGVTLVITVDVGVTAIEEVNAARAMGLDIVVTDHHQCRDELPDAAAVVNPCRPDCAHPLQNLAGVGVAFKLVCALAAPDVSAETMLAAYGDYVALGTVADVMPLTGENRLLVSRGLRLLESGGHIGLTCLMKEAGIAGRRPTAVSLGFALAPRINAAGRMGKTSTAMDLLLADDPKRASYLAAELCDLNRHRQQVETDIYKQALQLLEGEEDAPVIVLAHANWHPGVTGIVASRLTEHFGRPAFLVCLEDGLGKGSARGVDGTNLVAALESVADLLITYGGHELAAGFSLDAAKLDEFSRRLRAFFAPRAGLIPQKHLAVDCVLPPALFSRENVAGLQILEPHGMGNPPPVFCLESGIVDAITPVGGGRHVRLSLSCGGFTFQGIYFGIDAVSIGFSEGDIVDAAFHAEVNTFQNRSHVQLQIRDLRLAEPLRTAEKREMSLYDRFKNGEALSAEEAAFLRPSRDDLAAVWRHIRRHSDGAPYTDRLSSLARKAMRSAGLPMSFGRAAISLDVFSELSLIERWQAGDEITLETTAAAEKADLSASGILNALGGI